MSLEFMGRFWCRHTSSPTKRGFKYGLFTADNWNCPILNELRDILDYEDRDDMSAASIGVIHIPDHDHDDVQRGYIVMTWYKDRGTTGQAWVMWGDNPPEPLKKSTAKFVIDAYLN